MLWHHAGYVPVPQPGEDKSREKLHDDPSYGGFGLPKSGDFLVRHWAYFTHGILLLFCVVFFSLWIGVRTKLLALFPYSPANVAVEYHREYTVFNGTFDYPSIYRGPPSPEIDALWHNISKGVKLGRLTREQLLSIGKEDSPSIVRYLPEDGGGYMAALEVTHQLHCLNMLRKYLYIDHYSKTDTFFIESKPETQRMHIEHCIDNLRQVLMCSADSAMITFEWVRGFSGAYPDFSTRHRCRNFEKLIDWQNTNGIYGIPESHIIRLEGEVDMIHPP